MLYLNHLLISTDLLQYKAQNYLSGDIKSNAALRHWQKFKRINPLQEKSLFKFRGKKIIWHHLLYLTNKRHDCKRRKKSSQAHSIIWIWRVLKQKKYWKCPILLSGRRIAPLWFGWGGRPCASSPFGVPSPLTTFPTALGKSVFSAQALTPHSELPPCSQQCWHLFQTPFFSLLRVEHSKLLWELKLVSHKRSCSPRQTCLQWFLLIRTRHPQTQSKAWRNKEPSETCWQCYFPKSQVVSRFSGSNTIILHQNLCS